MADLKILRQRFEELKGAMEVGLFGTVSSEDVDAVLELIREAEPRVLTLEEVRVPERMVALEYKTYGILKDDELKPVMTLHKWAVYIGKCFDGDIEWTAFSLFHAFTNQMTLKTDNYGKTWRCWSADPVDELRRSTMWAMTDEMREAVRRDDEIASGVGEAFSPD